MHTSDFFDLPVKEVIRETDSAVSLVFDVPAALTEAFQYRPGQFLTVRVLIDGKYRLRCYSLASAPNVDALHKVTIKRVDRGLVSNELCLNVKAGQVLQVRPPAGVFGPAQLDQDFLLLAGGSGITPVLSILKAALAGGKGRIDLVYANRDETSVIFRDELIELSRKHPDRLNVIHWLETVQGLPTSDRLASLLRAFAGRDVFICGPAPFMDSSVVALESIGLSRDRIHLERFISLPDEEPEPAAVTGKTVETTQTATRLIVRLDGKEREIVWSAGQTMLDAMITADINAPFSCRVGGCAVCMCRIRKGEVTMAANLVLDERDLSDGWVLACQSQSQSEEVHCEFP
ncbi:2Fe-2S iron-sulfur cluster-binding protein [Pseudomonas sp. H11T01]|uniref:2Fe-2S iron-sulfur cluster-binding protein n=1 Tax=Pseudomonas sp. H11T01 TaxID=3402749 RepID=UPI003ACEF968